MLLKLNKLLIVHSFVIFISSNGYFFHPKESESDALKRITSGLENLTEPERKLEIQKRAEAHANSYNKYLESNPINERTQSLPRVKNFKRQTENAMHKMFEDESKWKGKESRIFENGSRIDEDGNSIPEQMYLDLKEKVKALRAKGNLKEIERINKAPKQYYTELNSKRSKNANIFSKKEETKDKSGDEELKNVVKTTTEDNNQKITKDGNEQQLASTLGQTETQTTANTTGDSSVQQNNENNKGEKTERGGGNIKRPRTKRLVKGTPKGRRIIKNPDYKKAIRHEVIDAYDIVLQAFIGGAKVHSDVIKKLYRNSKGEVRQRIQFLDNKNGFKTFDDFVHSLWENQPNIEQFTTQDFTKALEDVINSYTGTRAMVDDLNSRYKTDEELLEEEMQKAQEYEEYLRTTEENERYSQSDYDNGIDYWETLTDEDIAEMERAKDAILQMQIDDYFRDLEQQSKEQESTPKFSADDKKDAKKQEQQATANGILDYLKKKIPFISFVTDAKEYAEKRDEATKDLTNKSGDILGFVHNGKIYLDPAKLTPKTLAEEFTHLQQQALRLASKQGNKQAQKIVGAWDNATSKLADALISGNAKAKELLKELGIPESELASDVYKQQAGESKTAYKERLQDEIWAKAQKTEFAEHLERLSKENKFTATVNKMIDALKDFAKYIGQQLGIYNEKEWSKLSLSELIDRTNSAISGDKFLKGLEQGVSKGTPQFQKSQEQHKEISQKNFETLIDKLKKPFAKAFKNLNITHSWNDFVEKHEALKRFGSLENIVFAKQLEAVNSKFNNELKQLINGTLPKGHIFQLGKAGEILKSAGVEDLPIELSSDRAKEKSEQKNHPFNLEDLTGLSKAIQNPIAVFDSTKKDGAKVILTELKDNKGNNYVVALRVSNKGTGRLNVEINDVKSVYPKDNVSGVLDWINSNDNLLKYANKEKALNYISVQSTNLIGNGNTEKSLNDATKVIKDFQNPISDKDVKGVQYSILGFHGSPHLFEEFSNGWLYSGEGASGFGEGFHFTESKDEANDYARKLDKGDGKARVYKSKIPDLKHYFDISRDKYNHEQSKEVQNAILNIDDATAQKILNNDDATAKDLLDMHSRTFFDAIQENLYNNDYSAESKASAFLEDLGIKGNTHTEFGNRHFIVFNTDDIAIKQRSRVQFMHTQKGEVYGAKLPDGTIYINPEKLNANTPIHELSATLTDHRADINRHTKIQHHTDRHSRHDNRPYCIFIFPTARKK